MGLCQNEGKCEGKICNCKEGYFGAWCQNKIYNFGEEEVFTETTTIQPYSAYHFFESYVQGEDDTNLDITNKNKSMMVLVMNHRNDKKNEYYTEEYNRKDSQTFVLHSWVNNIERKNFKEENENLYIQLVNMDPRPIEVTFNISSKLLPVTRNQDEHFLNDFQSSDGFADRHSLPHSSLRGHHCFYQ